jgi:hypothetical protein
LQHRLTQIFRTTDVEELKTEITKSGLKFETVLSIESFGWLIPELGRKLDKCSYRELLLQSIRTIEENSSTMGISAHIMGVAIKK